MFIVSQDGLQVWQLEKFFGAVATNGQLALTFDMHMPAVEIGSFADDHQCQAALNELVKAYSKGDNYFRIPEGN